MGVASTVSCRCGVWRAVPTGLAGRRVRCRRCKQHVQMPGPTACPRCGATRASEHQACPRCCPVRPTTRRERLLLPGLLCALGVIGYAVGLTRVEGQGLGHALLISCERTAVWAGLALATCLLLGRLLFTTPVGSLRLALIRFGAVAAVPEALSLLTTGGFPGLGGAFLGLCVFLPCHVALLRGLFRLSVARSLLFSAALWLADLLAVQALSALFGG